jgi:hypothetical protein
MHLFLGIFYKMFTNKQNDIWNKDFWKPMAVVISLKKMKKNI